MDEIKLSKLRYLVLILYYILVLHINSQWTQFQVISESCKKLFNVTDSDVNWTVTIWYPAYLIAVFAVSSILTKAGIRYCIVAASLINCCGCCIKYIAARWLNFNLILFGQVFGGLGQVFTFFLPATLASTWFPSEVSSTITAIALSPAYVGVGFGYLIPSFLVPSVVSLSKTKTDFEQFTLIFAVSSFAIFLLIVFFFADKPKHPPSLASAKVTSNSVTYRSSLRSLFTNVNCNLILLCYSILQAILNSLLGLLSPMIQTAFPTQSHFIGLTGLGLQLISVPGSFLIAWLTDLTRCYRWVTLFTGLSMIPLFILFILAINWKSKIISVISSLLIGFILSSCYPVGFDYYAQNSYPISDSVTSTVMMFTNYGLSWPLTVLVSYLLQNYTLLISFIPIWISLAVAMISVCFVNQSLNRDKANNESIYIAGETSGENNSIRFGAC